jgi:predicted phosphodiesterase
MRLGLIADIHGNAFALRAVLAELDRIGVDGIYCLGDVASPGPWPAETIALLAERDILSVLGNTDEWLLAPDPACVSDVPATNEINAWCAAQLDGARCDWLSELPLVRAMDVNGATLAMTHGSPRSTDEVISAITPPDRLATMLDGLDASIVCGGHTHVQLLRNTEEQMIVNPGSVGFGGTGPGTSDLPPSRPVDAAEFAVLERVDGAVSVGFHHLPLDVPAMIAAAREIGMPGLPWWVSLWAE